MVKHENIPSCIRGWEPMCKGETGKGVNFTNILLDDLSVAQYQLLLSQALYEQEI